MRERIVKAFKILWVVALVAWFPILAPHTYIWSDAGEINVFPDYGNSVKSYRLPATIYVAQKGHGWHGGTKTYTVSDARWPDDGELDFDFECTMVEHSGHTCTTKSGDSYFVEVATAPERPEQGYDSN